MLWGVQADGKILVVGYFTGLGGGTGATPRNYIGRLTNTDAALQKLTLATNGTIINWLRSSASPEVDRVTFERSTDAINYTALANPSRISGGWQLTGQSLPTLQNIFIRSRGFYSTGEDNGSGSIVETVRNAFISPPPPLNSVASRMTHGSAGAFDIALPLTGTRGVECRSSASLGAGNYKLIFSFVNNLTSVGSASVTSGTGSVSTSAPGPNPNQYTVNLTGVIPPNPPGGEYLTVTLNNVVDAAGNSGNVLSPQMGVLVGDVNGSGTVTSGDTNLCKSQALKPVAISNFRNDINASGSITTGDANLVKQNALHQLPSPP